MIWIALALMTAAAALVTLWPLAFGSSVRDDSNSEIAFYSAQLAEIDRDVERGQLPPDEAASARAEAGRRLLAARAAAGTSINERSNDMRRRLAAICGLLLIAGVGAGVYAKLGRPGLPDAALAARQDKEPVDPVAVALAHIEADAAASPDSVKAWSTLAPAYLRLGRYSDSVMAYRKLLRLIDEDAGIRASLGEAEVAAAGGKVTAEAKADFEKALSGDPSLGLARYYVGLAAEQAGDVQTAVETYEAVLPTIQDHPRWVEVINGKLAALKNEPPAKVEKTEAAPAQAAAAPADGAKNPPDMIQGMVARLAARIEKNGGSADEWLRLIRSYAVMEQPDKARVALATARAAHGADAKDAAEFDAIEKELHLDGSAPVTVAQAAASPAEAPAKSAEQAAPAQPAGADQKPPEDLVQGMVSRLAKRIEQKGGNSEEWLQLIRSYSVLQTWDKAKAALASARKALGGDARTVAALDAIEQEFHLDQAAPPPPVLATDEPAKPAVEPVKPAEPATTPNASQPEPDMIQGMVGRLAARIEKNGGSADEWLRLIRSYAVMEQPDKAKAALASARQAHGGDAKASADLDAIAQEFHLGAP
jgi:cytochrome c-type biogenesis protein CcmI